MAGRLKNINFALEAMGSYSRWGIPGLMVSNLDFLGRVEVSMCSMV